MHFYKTDPANTGTFSSLFLDYINKSPEIAPFYSLFPEPDNFRKQSDGKAFSSEKRQKLASILKEQHSELNLDPLQTKNIESIINHNSFTVTTGHQLNLGTGPLYFIYKIFTAIKTCEELNQKFPDLKFIPIYWMASEDHDIEEIDHFTVFGKKYRWETEEKGPSGRASVEGIKELFNQVPDLPEFIKSAYTEKKNLGHATRELVNTLFGKYGLLVLDADNSALKQEFIPVLIDELINKTSFHKVSEINKELDKKNYTAQVNPREINLFYMKDNFRERIIYEDNVFKILNSNKTFSQEEIIEEVKLHPENFSPNVILRPLYQEIILPNVCYIGGPAEIAYWFQLKSLFQYYKIPFPVLLPRNFFLYITAAIAAKLKKLELEPAELFDEPDTLKKKILEKETGKILSVQAEEEGIEKLFSSLSQKANGIDPSLAPWVQAEKQKALKQLDNIARRLKKAEEQKHEIKINQILNLKEKLFPNGTLQERTENFLTYFINNHKFLDEVHRYTESFNFSFKILTEDE